MRFPRVRFTIRSMMAVVALGALLSGAALLVQRLSEAALRDRCQFNVRYIALGLAQYSTAYNAFPTGTIANDQLPPENRLSWLVTLWDFIEQQGWLLDHSLA